jgi:hypothetical protein
MKTLDQINEDICLAVENRMKYLKENGLGDMVDSSLEDTLRKTYAAVEVNRVFMKLYDIVVKLDEYLKYSTTDGKLERLAIHSDLKEMVSKL